MITTATELMKRLKFIEQDIATVHQNDERDSYVPVVESTNKDGHKTLSPAYDVVYDFMGNRERIKALQGNKSNLPLPVLSSLIAPDSNVCIFAIVSHLFRKSSFFVS